MKKNKLYRIKRKNKNKLNIKKILLIFITIMLLTTTTGCIQNQNKTIKISGAFALYPMMGIWAEEYKKTHPEIKIDISAGGAGKGMSDAIIGIVDIGMVSREIYQEEINQGVFWISVAKDAVVATINSNNPVLDTILQNGITKQQFTQIFITRTLTTWGDLINDSTIKDNIRVYTRSDSCGAAQTWAQYLGDYTQDDLTNVADSAINGDPNLAAAIQDDSIGIGYNNINFIYDPSKETPYANLIPCPIDINENGILDNEEKFYDTRAEIVNAINQEMYPSPPARALHLVTLHEFTGETKEFLHWILTEGQQYIPTSGYIQLPETTIQQQIQYLQEGQRPEIT